MVRATIVAGLLGALLVAAPVADASFPGRDGALAFNSTFEDDCPLGHDDSSGSCTYSFFRVQPSGRKQTRLSSCGTRATPQCNEGGPAWSADGKLIAFSSEYEIWVMRANGSGRHSLGASGNSPAWSPDGRRIAFIRVDGVHVMNADGTDVHRVPIASSESVAWSSTNRLAFVREIAGVRRDLMTSTPEGEDQRVVVTACRCDSPDFSPDGKRIAYSVGDRKPALHVVASEGGSPTRLLGRASQPAWSPTGRQIAFTRGRDIYVARRDGSGARRVPYDAKRRLGDDIGGDYSGPAWQPLPR